VKKTNQRQAGAKDKRPAHSEQAKANATATPQPPVFGAGVLEALHAAAEFQIDPAMLAPVANMTVGELKRCAAIQRRYADQLQRFAELRDGVAALMWRN
jgi:hypothetical protein